MGKIIQSVDVGSGFTKYVTRQIGREISCDLFPSVAKAAVGGLKSFQKSGLGAKHSSICVEVKGNKYEVGPDVDVVGASRQLDDSHQNRSITVTYTPGTTYTVEGGYDFVGNFDAIFNQTNSSFEFDVRNMDIDGSAVDGSLTSGSFEVNGAGNTKLVFTLRNDGTLVFTADEDGNGSVDFTSTALITDATVGLFDF